MKIDPNTVKVARYLVSRGVDAPTLQKFAQAAPSQSSIAYNDILRTFKGHAVGAIGGGLVGALIAGLSKEPKPMGKSISRGALIGSLLGGTAAYGNKLKGKIDFYESDRQNTGK